MNAGKTADGRKRAEGDTVAVTEAIGIVGRERHGPVAEWPKTL